MIRAITFDLDMTLIDFMRLKQKGSSAIHRQSAMAYRAVAELEDMDLIDISDGIKLTDAGRIARL